MNPLEVLKEQRRKERIRFLEAIRSPDIDAVIITDKGFSDFVGLATSEYGVSQQEIAKLLDISPPAVSRWKTGQARPAPYSRVQIKHVIADVLKADIDNPEPPAEPPVSKSGVITPLRRRGG